MHTGPGRGYPVFFVAARDEWVEIQLRFTDWYKVRTEGGKEGWVHRSQLEQHADRGRRAEVVPRRRARRLPGAPAQLGAAWGEFKKEPMLKMWTSYRLSDTLSVEGTIGQVQGTFSGTDFWHVNVLAEPWSDMRLSPFFGIGVGKFKNIPNASLVGAHRHRRQSRQRVVGAALLPDRSFRRARSTTRCYTAFVADTRTAEYRAWTPACRSSSDALRHRP